MCVGLMQCFNNGANEGNIAVLGSVTSEGMEDDLIVMVRVTDHDCWKQI